jgi:3-deoxy-D-manno-octulosonate 8-phosphate phosphatase (KDO 8-P phosphatase)
MPNSSSHDISDDVLARAARVRLACFDVDGVLTDGKLWYADGEQEIKAFHVHDGLGLKLLRDNGIEIALITARQSRVVEKRALELGIEHVYQGQKDKLGVFTMLLESFGLTAEQASYTGDDLPDLAVMRLAGLAIAVANAHPWIKPHAHWTTRHSGGNGAVREVSDLLLLAQGRVDGVLAALGGQ